MRRSGQQHHVDAAVDHLLIGVEADELPIGRDIDFFADAGPAAKLFQATVDWLLESITHGPQHDLAVSVKCLVGGA